jgi:hypothetical protein
MSKIGVNNSIARCMEIDDEGIICLSEELRHLIRLENLSLQLGE